MKLPKQAWGNAAGWTSATLIAVAVGALLAVVGATGSMTPATAFGRDSANFGPIALPIDPGVVAAEVRPSNADAAGDVGAIYRDAADAYLADAVARRRYEDFAESATAPAVDLPLLGRLAAALGARAGATVTIFGDDAASLVNYDRSLPRLEALYTLGRAAVRQAGLLARRNAPGDLDRARQGYAAAFALGVRLFEERVVHREMELGYRLLSQSAGGLAALAQKAGDAPRAAELRKTLEAFKTYVNGRLEPTWAVIGAVNDTERTDDAADAHPGDVALIALDPRADPMWRAEAILRLGKYRVDATRRGDRAGADRLVTELAKTLTDPRLKLAADQAAKLTRSQRLNAR